jgi:aspartate aminotransferase-like enzyme
VLFQAEAIALLEASVKALAVPGEHAAGVLTSIYGQDMNAWFESSGCPTVSLDLVDRDRAAGVAEVAALLDSDPAITTLQVVQGEALTGLCNPIDAIAELAGARDITLIIDSVSSVGAEPFTPQRWGRAISVIGAQKGLGGPSGLSLAVIETSLWERIEANPAAPRHSFLSLLDIKHNWLDPGRAAFFGMPSAEEMALLLPALAAAIDRGIGAIEAQSATAARTARTAIREIDGFELTVLDDAQASGVATAFRASDPGVDPARVLAGLSAQGISAVKPAPGPRLRWTHYGESAEPESLARVSQALAASLALLPG